MNAIYLHPVDGFTFLENVPEKPNYCTQQFGKDCDFEDMSCRCKRLKEDYERALTKCIEKRMVIGNPEVFAYKDGDWYCWKHDVMPNHADKFIKEGELYPWPYGYKVKEEKFMSNPPIPTGNKIVILSLPKVEPVNSSMSEKEEKTKWLVDANNPSQEVDVPDERPLAAEGSQVVGVKESEFDKKNVWQGKGRHVYPEPWNNWPTNENEQINFFLVNVLRLLNGEQAKILAKNILERLPSEPVVSQDQEEPKLWSELIDHVSDFQFVRSKELFELLLKTYTLKRK